VDGRGNEYISPFSLPLVEKAILARGAGLIGESQRDFLLAHSPFHCDDGTLATLGGKEKPLLCLEEGSSFQHSRSATDVRMEANILARGSGSCLLARSSSSPSFIV